MQIYADILVIVNLYIDYFLLWCVRKALGLNPKKGRLVLGALTGGISSLLALLPVSRPLLLLFGLLAALLSAAAAFAPVKPFLFLRAAAAFWIFSFLLAGFLLFLLTFFPTRSLAVLGNAVYFDISPLFLLLATCGAYAVLSLARRLLPKAEAPRCCEITVAYGAESARLFCKSDTGCALHEPFSGLPVIVAEKAAIGNAAPAEVLAYPDISGGGLRLIPFDTIGGGGLLPAFRPEKVFLSKTGNSLNCYVALYPKKLSAGQYNAVFNPELFSESHYFKKYGGTL